MDFLTQFGLAASSDPVVCDTVPALDSFDPTRYIGVWYGIAHATHQPFQPDAWTCTQAIYTDLDLDTKLFKVWNSSQSRWGGPRFGIHGKAQCIDDYPTGKCSVNFSPLPWSEFIGVNYEVIETDYETYSIVYHCDTEDMAYVWYLSRTPTMDADTFAHVDATARATLPNFDFENNLTFDKQGEENKCNYSSGYESYLF